MKVLRIRGSLAEAPLNCRWVLFDGERAAASGAGTLAQLPRRADRVQLSLPASQVLLTRVRLPDGARGHARPVLAFAIEDRTLGEPEAQQVSWLGRAGEDDVVAAVDKRSLQRWLDALEDTGVGMAEIHCDTLALPWKVGEWSFAWNGDEGIVRCGEFEGAATDRGDRAAPPLLLGLMLEQAQARGERPPAIALYPMTQDAIPDIAAWQKQLGVALRVAGAWNWDAAPKHTDVGIPHARRHWRGFPGMLAKLRPAAWIAGCALALHALALATDWMLLEGRQRALRQQMEARFRAAFPDAVAVVDPALQMRRKLAEARHVAGQPDSGDFSPMIAKVAAGAADLPPGTLRALAFESGRMTLEFAPMDGAVERRMLARLRDAGLIVDPPPAVRPAKASFTLAVRSW